MQFNTLFLIVALALSSFSPIVLAAPIIALEKPLPEPIAKRCLGVNQRGWGSWRQRALAAAAARVNSGVVARALEGGPTIGEFGTGIRRPFGKSRRLTEEDLEGSVKGKASRRDRVLKLLKGGRNN